MSEQPPSKPKQCEGTRRDGQPCPGPVPHGGRFCFAHDPEKRAARDAGRRKGGANRSNLARIQRLVPPRLIKVYDRLEKVLEEVHDGTLPPSRALAMAAVARAMIACLQAGELEDRMRQLEQRAGQRAG